MALHRFFLEAPVTEDAPLPLSARDRHHARVVLRIRPGDEVVAVEPAGRVLRIRVMEVAEEGVRGEVLGIERPEGGPRVTLVQGVARGPRMDLAVQKAVEVGVTEIVPFLSRRSVVKLDARGRSEKAARWQRIAEEAAKQSQRSFVPHVREPVPVRSLPEALTGHDLVLVLWEEAGRRAEGIGEALERAGVDRGARVAVVVGPEGGLDAEEVAFLTDAGAVPVTLGATILRSETAGVVGPALVLYELGGLGGRGRG